MEKELQRVVLQGDQFNQLLLDHQGKYPREFQDIHFIVGDITLPAGRLDLPTNVTFNGNLDARQAEMTYFSYTVNGSANFAGRKELLLFGEKAYFNGDLDASSTGLTTFNRPVGGNLLLHDCTDLEVIGSKTRAVRLDAHNCHHLEGFHGVIQKDVNFSNCMALRIVGSDALVGGAVNLEGTPIEDQRDKLFPKLRATAALPGEGETLAIRLPKKESYREVMASAGITLPAQAIPSDRSPGNQPVR